MCDNEKPFWKTFYGELIQDIGVLSLIIFVACFVWPVIAYGASKWAEKWDFHWDPEYYRTHNEIKVITTPQAEK